MEVHAHTHTERKKFTHYLWEFLMLFLAVFCGFLAENWRENLLEKTREKQFIFSLLNDLRSDANWFNSVNQSAKERIHEIDSAILFFSEFPNTKMRQEMPLDIYQELQKSMFQIFFLPHDETLTQLKSSGGLRLITNRRLVDSIENYDRLLRRLEIRRNYTDQLTHDFKQTLDKTIVGTTLLAELNDTMIYQKKTSANWPIKFIYQNLNEVINEIIALRSRIVSDTTTNTFVKGKALDLAEFIGKEYHLK